MTIGQRIRDRRIELNLNPKDIADKIEKSLSTYYRYETGEIEKLTISKICEIAEILQVSPIYLLLGLESENENNTYKNSNTKHYNIISFSEKLRELMAANRLTVEQFVADIFDEYNIKITVREIKDWENGIGSPNIASFIAIADYFHVSVDYLIGKSSILPSSFGHVKAKEPSVEYNKEKFVVKNIKKLLNNSEYSAEELAEKTKIDIEILREYYNGNCDKIAPNHIKVISDVLEISMIDIMYERNAGPIIEKISLLDAVQLYDLEEYINKLLKG